MQYKLDPAQMLDSELCEAMKEYQVENTIKTDRRKTRVLAEYSRRFLSK